VVAVSLALCTYTRSAPSYTGAVFVGNTLVCPSLTNNLYHMIGLPPSTSGGSHVRVILVLVISVKRGRGGGAGGSALGTR